MKEVLLIDDQVDIQVIIADCLRNYGISVDACGNGQQASEKLNKKKYDLIITDLNMPKEDGFSIIYKAQNIVKHAHSIPIIVITGGAKSFDFESNLEKLEGRVVRVLRKPFTKDQLLEAVCEAFEIEMDQIESLIEGL